MSSQKDKNPNNRDAVRSGIEGAEAVALPGKKKSGKVNAGSVRVESECGRYYRDAHGLFLKQTDKDGNNKDLLLASPVWLIAEAKTLSGIWGLLLGWIDRDGEDQKRIFWRDQFSGDVAELRGQLAAGGVTFPPGPAAKGGFTGWLASLATKQRAIVVERTGWHTVKDRRVFVLPDVTYGESEELVILQTAEQETTTFNVSGTVQDWIDNIGLYCRGNSRLTMAAAAAFGAPLIGLLNLESGGISFRGNSRSGKSTALTVAASVCGGTADAGTKGYMRSWRATSNGLEGVALASCDNLLVLDEMGEMDPKEIGGTAYMLGNGAGKLRAGRKGEPRAQARWRVLFMSSGEKGLDEMNREAGRVTKAGQAVRLVDLPADAGQGMGLFENIYDFDVPGSEPQPGAFADFLGENCGRYYGAPLRAYLEKLTALMTAEGIRPFRERLLNRLDEITAGYLAKWPGASGQVRSVARRFAMITIGGELATEFGLTGWDKDAPEVMVGLCFDSWLHDRGTAGRKEDQQAIQALREFISRFGHSRFLDWVPKRAGEYPEGWDEGKPPPERFRIQNAAGWRKWAQMPDGNWCWVYHLTLEGMREILSGLDFEGGIRALRDARLIIQDSQGKNTHGLTPPDGARVRLYVVSANILSVSAKGG